MSLYIKVWEWEWIDEVHGDFFLVFEGEFDYLNPHPTKYDDEYYIVYEVVRNGEQLRLFNSCSTFCKWEITIVN